MTVATRRLFLLVAFLLSGCAVVQPDLSRLYDFDSPSDEQPPLILIHGAFGGRLVDEAGTERWPGSLNRLLWADYRDIALEVDQTTLLPKDSDLSVSGITEKVAGQDYYGKIREVLEEVGRYQYHQAGDAIDGSAEQNVRRYYVFEYD